MIGTQEDAIEKIKRGESLFLTGNGGSGKSFVIRQVTDSKTILCAPTGVAALNIGGSTLHSVFGLPVGIRSEDELDEIKPAVRKLFSGNNITRVIIDEAPMMRAEMLDMINHKLKIIKDNNKPFGGLQIVLVGDFFQIEPIITKQERKAFNALGYESPFIFHSDCWEEMDLQTVVMTKNFRQESGDQIEILNAIRTGSGLKRALKRLNSIATIDEDLEETDVPLVLCPLKTTAQSYNDMWLKLLKGKGHSLKATKEGRITIEETRAASMLKLKEGARVIFNANDSEKQFVNGEMGTFLNVNKNMITREIDSIDVKKDNGEIVKVVRNVWEKQAYTLDATTRRIQKEVVGSVEQFPLLLGYACSIHSSQGLTLDRYLLDISSGCFSHGQCYVALSRIRDLKNLVLARKIREEDIIIHPEVKKFYESVEV